MRSLTTLFLGGITAMLLTACSGDQTATTAPTTTPSFKKVSPLSSTKTYRFSFSCTPAAAAQSTPTDLIVGVYHSEPPDYLNRTDLEFHCGDPSSTQTDVYSFDYRIVIYGVTSCDNGSSNIYTTGAFTCRYQQYAATLTVAEVSP